MNKKIFSIFKIVAVIIVAIIASISFNYGNWYLPTTTLLVAWITLFILRSKVKEVIADERDYEIGGKAARMTIQIFSSVAVIAMFIFHAYKDINPSYEAIAMTLAFSACLLLFLYTLLFRFYGKVTFSNKKTLYTLIGVLIILAVTILGMRFLSGEDDWICKNGEWIKHGNPSFSAPQTQCK